MFSWPELTDSQLEEVEQNEGSYKNKNGIKEAQYQDHI